MIADVATPAAIVILTRSLQRTENADLRFAHSRWHALRTHCEALGGTRYACKLVLAAGAKRRVRSYPNCTFTTLPNGWQWTCRDGELLP